MKRNNNAKRRGFTLVELMLTIFISSIVMLGIGVTLVDSQRGWSKTFDRVHSDAVRDALASRIAFDTIVRKASVRRALVDIDNQFVEVYYYSDPGANPAPALDRYARFYKSGTELKVDYGTLDQSTWITTQQSTNVLARNVNSVKFTPYGAGISMVLDIQGNNEVVTVASSAIRHNE